MKLGTILKDWIESKEELNQSEINFSQSDGIDNDVTVLEINIENVNRLGLILVYEDGFMDVHIHDKIIVDPIQIESFSFDESNMLLLLEQKFLRYWT